MDDEESEEDELWSLLSNGFGLDCFLCTLADVKTIESVEVL